MPTLRRIPEFAAERSLAPAVVRAGIRRGVIPVVKIGRNLRVDLELVTEGMLARLAGETATHRGRVFEQQVYFLGPQDGPIKIGIAARPQARLDELQVAHWQRLHIWATVAGGARAEREYHQRFAEHRLEGEWFARHPDILAAIADVEEVITDKMHMDGMLAHLDDEDPS